MLNIDDIVERTPRHVRELIEKRWLEFKRMNRKGSKEWFSELCFCILTANASAEMGMRAQKSIGIEGFTKLRCEELSKALKKSGYRFYNKRAEYIYEARKYAGNIKEIVNKFDDEYSAREWLVKNIKGIGYKEASHFLRNVGYDNLAILDKHILSIMRECGMITDGLKINPKNYIILESKLKRYANKLGMPLGKLDLYLWYHKTGKVLK